ncbi:MAG TPA: ABC transporter ATP-binding protein [Candidatus Thermoplasmatota archaeon]|nr:ABC transporter ATP-binding protein [Candidatus Thermoplasmatota archaeon]
MSRLRVQGLSHTFASKAGPVQALAGIDLDVKAGEFVVLIGPSGCGKSTLLSLVAGLEAPTQGSIDVEGKPVQGPSRDRILLFQEGALFPWLDARANVEFALKGQGLPRAARRQKAMDHLAMVQLESFENARIHELSGGMRQRVALARALAMEPKVLLMDEPFAALDAQTRDGMLERVQTLWMRQRFTCLFVTHNVREAACLGDRVIVMSPRPGTIKAEIKVEAPRPRHIEDDAVVQAARSIKAALVEELGWML